MKIEAKIIADSISPSGKRLTTFELVYPRIIHSEVMTHKMLSKNAASSRAIPVQKIIDMVINNPAMPVRFGSNQAGMQDRGVEHTDLVWIGGGLMDSRRAWEEAALSAASFSDSFNKAGYHKQVCNRLTEPFQWMKTVMSGTEYENYFWLRNHDAADPTLHTLASAMYTAYEDSDPVELQSGDWHVPYYQDGYWIDEGDGKDFWGNILKDAMSISMSCCAQVSYRVLDDTIEKAEKVVSRLNLDGEDGEPVHASPTEHQGTPMKETENEWGVSLINEPAFIRSWEDGITAYHKQLGFMSGNLAGFIQYRQLIEGNTRWG